MNVTVHTSWSFTDNSMCAVFTGPRPPETSVALNPEAAVGGQHAQISVLLLPVTVVHYFTVGPLQTAFCRIKRIHRGLDKGDPNCRSIKETSVINLLAFGVKNHSKPSAVGLLLKTLHVFPHKTILVFI